MSRTLVCALLLSLAADAAGQSPDNEGRTAWHVVKPGDTLEDITEHYLGDRSRWPENHALNPDVRDPHKLTPGQRLRILLPEARSAEVRRVERRVEEKPHPSPWTPAKVGDRLKERDGVRTYRSSSAELVFDNGSRIVLTEDSLIFLRELGLVRAGASRDALEIVEGQADFERRPTGGRSNDIEIVVGQAKARPRAGSDASSETRARLPKSGEAQLMVYRGETAVEAAGKKVDVGRGMGTSVPKDGPPRPPEQLLAGPALTFPARGARLLFANPTLRFEAVPGAASYTVEVCRDAGCGALVARGTDLTGGAFEPGDLPAGELFWRVTAVSASGLDGYPSESSPFTVEGGGADREPPAVVVYVRGRGQARGEVATLAAGDGILLDARDDTGVLEIRYRWDGGAYETYRGKELTPPRGRASSTLEVYATDNAGRRSKEQRIQVVR